MIDKAITRFGIGLALLLMVSELTYINAKSLTYMVQEFGTIDRYFAVIGSLAFSIVTVIIMRTSERRWPKIVFPVFDVLLVFCGFNLKYYEAIVTGTDNMVRFSLSIFMAMFTGFITYCLGIINYEKYVKNDTDETEGRIYELIRKLDESERKRMELNRNVDDLKRKLSESERIINETKRKADETAKLLIETKTIANRFLRNHILYECWLSKKKSETNRNGKETILNQLAERIKQGETITIEEYLNLNN